MAKMSMDFLARIKGKYGWSGGNYRGLMRRIIEHNHEKIANAAARVKVMNLKAKASTLGGRWKRLVLPDLSEVLPKRSVFIRKAAEQGALLTDDLRTRLNKNLRDSMKNFTTSTGEQAYAMRTGKKRGRLNPRLADVFESQIMDTFQGYTKRDPSIGIPPNIRSIAVTETRAVVNDVKHSYFKRLIEKNDGMQIKKQWIHNPGLSRTEPRPGHARMNGKSVEMDEEFDVPVYEKRGKRWHRTGRTVRLLHPHDPKGEAEDVINCHCDIDYIAKLPPS